MASLTTVYIISVIVASIAGMGSAFVGNKIYPLKGGQPPPLPAEVADVKPAQQTKETITVPLAITPPPLITAENLAEVISTKFGMDDEFAKNVLDFIKTPVTDWTLIANTRWELNKKFMKTLSHPNLNKCPANLRDVCNLVTIKYTNMKDFIDNKNYMPIGDQTDKVVDALSNSS